MPCSSRLTLESAIQYLVYFSPKGDGGDLNMVAPAFRLLSESTVRRFILASRFPAVGRRRAVFTAAMPVPEAAVHEKNGLEFDQDHIRPSGKVLSVQAEAKSQTVQQRAYDFSGFVSLPRMRDMFQERRSFVSRSLFGFGGVPPRSRIH
jgi:hypothetical protein